MTTVDNEFLSPHGLLQGDQVCLDGKLITNATKFCVQCLQLPRSMPELLAEAGISQEVWDFYADILVDLGGVFYRLWLVSDSFSAIIGALEAACRQIGEFAEKVDSSLKTLFDLFRELRDHPSSDLEQKIHKLNMEFIILANNANRTAGAIDFERIITGWSAEKQSLDDLYSRVKERMKDTRLQGILDKLLKTEGGGIPGLEYLKTWIATLSDREGKAFRELKLFAGSIHAVQTDVLDLEGFLHEPHSEKSDRFMRTEVANLLSRWKVFHQQVEDLRRDHLRPAVDDINNARRR